ncbi:LytR/AlgR family response regulator transcription factor [Dokdonella sp.]|uniref:LytR/AlgR family response regulator transcription factor n=1 Tax=Dokdonella sp. TaxID=2291710 RepID=UPI0031C66384|nr:LytTR family DNA-binding domain-containing protein [Dokdonella sp.]
MKVLVVDDEPLARERLAGLLQGIEGVELAGLAGNGREAIEQVVQGMPDLVLLDIRMPLMDGLEAARHLATLEAPPAVVFCTAFGDHALAAFEAEAIDYLLKPVREERLRAALDKARRWTRADAPALDGLPRQRRSHLCARVRGNLLLVPVADIHYLLAEDKYVLVHHAGGKVLIEESLKTLEEEFGDLFVRIHRNCLVAIAHLGGLVRAGDGRLLARVTASGAELEVSRRNLPALRKLVKSL